MSAAAAVDKLGLSLLVTTLLATAFAVVLCVPVAVLIDLLFGLTPEAVAHGTSWVLDGLSYLAKLELIAVPWLILLRLPGKPADSALDSFDARRANRTVMVHAAVGLAVLLVFLACAGLYLGRWRGFPEFGSFDLVKIQSHYWVPLLMLGAATVYALLRVKLLPLADESDFAQRLLIGLRAVLLIALVIYYSEMGIGKGFATLW